MRSRFSDERVIVILHPAPRQRAFAGVLLSDRGFSLFRRAQWMGRLRPWRGSPPPPIRPKDTASHPAAQLFREGKASLSRGYRVIWLWTKHA